MPSSRSDRRRSTGRAEPVPLPAPGDRAGPNRHARITSVASASSASITANRAIIGPCGFGAVTTNAAKIMGLEGYGLDVGCNGDLMVLQAADPIEAIRLKARRLFVVRRGQVIAESPRAVTRLDLPGRPAEVDAASYAPRGSN